MKSGLSKVLIPVWCNWNLPFYLYLHTHEFVLIPVWCNWNRTWQDGSKQDQEVLIPVWCNWNPSLSYEGSHFTMVLIPVWCNWNEIEKIEETKILSFNSCMVQLKSGLFQADLLKILSFNSCMVQLKCQRRGAVLEFVQVLIPVWCNWNPCPPARWRRRPGVLIPVWCNWNKTTSIVDWKISMF